MKNALWQNIFKSSDSGKSQTITALKQVPVFEGLTDREIHALTQLVHNRQYDVGEHIFELGTPGLGMYVLLKGEVVIQGDDTNGSKVEFARLQGGDFFGEVSLISEDNRSVEAIAETECKLVAFFRSDLLDVITRSPKLGNKILMNLAGILGQRLKKTNEIIQTQTTDQL
jgi:CRP-like cAMP-binding protein